MEYMFPPEKFPTGKQEYLFKVSLFARIDPSTGAHLMGSRPSTVFSACDMDQSGKIRRPFDGLLVDTISTGKARAPKN